MSIQLSSAHGYVRIVENAKDARNDEDASRRAAFPDLPRVALGLPLLQCRPRAGDRIENTSPSLNDFDFIHVHVHSTSSSMHVSRTERAEEGNVKSAAKEERHVNKVRWLVIAQWQYCQGNLASDESDTAS